MTSISNRDWLMRLAHEAPDELAAWMDAEHGTNVIADETNGIHADAPLVARDPVEIMRKCGGMEHGMGSLRKVLGIECVSGWQMRCLKALADMVERDYVPREDYEDLRDEFTWTNTFLHRMGKKCGTKDVPSLKAYVEQLEAKVECQAEAIGEWELRCERLESECDEYEDIVDALTRQRDEWKTKLDAETKARNACARHAANMEAERDEWKAKAEGSSKVRAGSSSAKRAAAVERLKDVGYHTLADYVRAMLGWGHEPHFEDCRDALIDLLTDESCGQDADQGIRAEAPVRESCTNIDAARYERRVEELEDELRRSYDAQGAKAEELTRRGVRIAELQEQVDKLTAERDGWRTLCGKLLDAAHEMQLIADVWEV